SRHCGHVVADEKDGPSFLGDTPHLAQTFALKLRIPHGQHLIDDEYLWLQMGHDRNLTRNLTIRQIETFLDILRKSRIKGWGLSTSKGCGRGQQTLQHPVLAGPTISPVHPND